MEVDAANQTASTQQAVEKLSNHYENVRDASIEINCVFVIINCFLFSVLFYYADAAPVAIRK